MSTNILLNKKVTRIITFFFHEIYYKSNSLNAKFFFLIIIFTQFKNNFLIHFHEILNNNDN